MIHVYNRNTETHIGENNYPIYRGGSILANPYTEIKDRKTRAKYIVSTKEEAIKKYDEYFNIMYGSNVEFTHLIDEIYEKYKRGEEVYLECYCAPQPCHGDVIKRKLESRLIKERINDLKNKKNENIKAKAVLA